MEQTKLTVRLPRDLVEEAKRYAKDHDTTLTRLVSEYFRQLGSQSGLLRDAPIVRRLSGVLTQAATIGDHRQYLEEKYGNETSSPDRP